MCGSMNTVRAIQGERQTDLCEMNSPRSMFAVIHLIGDNAGGQFDAKTARSILVIVVLLDRTPQSWRMSCKQDRLTGYLEGHCVGATRQ